MWEKGRETEAKTDRRTDIQSERRKGKRNTGGQTHRLYKGEFRETVKEAKGDERERGVERE